MNNYYDELGYGQPLPSSDLVYIAEQAREEKDFAGAALKEAMSPFAMKRIWDRRSAQFEEDTEWNIDDQTKQALQEDYTPEEEQYLTEGKSEEEFIARKKYIQEDKDRLQAIGQAGYKGIAATLGFSLIDPIGLALGAVTGEIGWGAKLTGVAKALRVATMSGFENAALETILMQGNTQSKASDVIMAFGTGSIIGAALSPLTRVKNPKLAKHADMIDEAAHWDADAIVADEILQDARVKAPVSELDMRTIQARLNKHEQSLTRETKNTLTKGQVRQIRKKMFKIREQVDIENEKIRTAQGEVTEARQKISIKEREYVDEVNAKKTEIIDSFSQRILKQKKRITVVEKNLEKAKNSKKQVAKLWKEEVQLEDIRKERQVEIKKVEVKYKRKIAAAKRAFEKKLAEKADAAKQVRATLGLQMREHEITLYAAKKNRDSLKKWKQLPEKEKIATVYGDEELPVKQVELDRQLEGLAPVREAKIEAVVEPTTVPVPEATKLGTAGAMKAGERPLHHIYDFNFDKQRNLARFAYDGSNMPEDLRGRQFLGKPNAASEKIYAAQTITSNSDDLAIRGFSYHLFEAPQGGTAAKVTVAARVRNYHNQIRSAMRNRTNEGLEEWGKEQGIGRLALLMKRKNFSAYHKMVMREVKHPGLYNSPAVIKGAEGVREQLKLAGKIRSEAGEAGFENLDLDSNYVPVILDDVQIKYAVKQHGNDKVRDLLSLSYQEGHFKLNKNLADRVADGYIARAKDHTLTMTDTIKHSTDKDVDKLAEQLKEAGVDQATIDDFLETSLQSEIRQHISNRAKKSLYPSLDTELNGLKMIDLIDSDLPKLMESYTRDAAGGAAFAKLGFKTKAQVFDFITDIEKNAHNNGFNPVKIGKEIQILKDGVDLAYGRSLNKDAHSPFVRNLSRLRDITNLIRLQFVGAASIPELARSTVQRGIKNNLEACKDLGAIMGTKSLREGGKYSGLFKRSDLKELEEVMGYTGEDFVLYPNGLRVDNLEESAVGNKFGELMDNALAQGQRIQEITSGFRAVQGTGEKLAVRSLGSQIKKWVEGSGAALSEANINRAGWSDGFLDDLKVWMKGNPATDIFNGREIRLFNFGKMGAEMQERLQIGMHRLIAADMQRPMIGESPMFMHKWLGQTITQFRSFSLLSLEKQLVHDIRHDRIAGSLIFLHSAAMAYAALSIQTLQNALGREDQDEYIKKHLASSRTVYDVMSRMGQLAAGQTVMDGLATLGLLPDDMMSSSLHPGGRIMRPNYIPVVGLATDATGAARTLAETLVGETDDSDLLKDVRKITPFAKTIGINQALNALEQGMKD